MYFSDNILLFAVPVFVVLSVAEALVLYRENRDKSIKKDFITSAALGLGFIIISILTKGIILYCYEWLYQFRLFELEHQQIAVWLVCFLADDFTYYWFHRISHTVRFFWASHIVHHSSQHYSFSAALRQTWTGNFTGTFLFWGWLPLIGFNPVNIIIIKSISLIYQFWLHTEKIGRLPGWFEFVFNSPSHHRVHHGSNIEYLDKNYGGTLIIWDRIFRSFADENIHPVYGLTKNIKSGNIFLIALHEWKQIIKDCKKMRHKQQYLRILFNKPGWQPAEKKEANKPTVNEK